MVARTLLCKRLPVLIKNAGPRRRFRPRRKCRGARQTGTCARPERPRTVRGHGRVRQRSCRTRRHRPGMRALNASLELLRARKARGPTPAGRGHSRQSQTILRHHGPYARAPHSGARAGDFNIKPARELVSRGGRLGVSGCPPHRRIGKPLASPSRPVAPECRPKFNRWSPP